MSSDQAENNNKNADKDTSKSPETIMLELNQELELMNKYLYKYVSYKHVVFRGILTGVAYFIGATLIIALAFAFLTRIQFVPVIGDFVVQILQFIEESYPSEYITK